MYIKNLYVSFVLFYIVLSCSNIDYCKKYRIKINVIDCFQLKRWTSRNITVTKINIRGVIIKFGIYYEKMCKHQLINIQMTFIVLQSNLS